MAETTTINAPRVTEIRRAADDADRMKVYQCGWDLQREDEQWSAFVTHPRPSIVNGGNLKKEMERITRSELFQGTTVHFVPGNRNMGHALGGWRLKKEVKEPNLRKWTQSWRNGMDRDEARQGYTKEREAYDAAPWIRWYMICVPIHMRNWWTFTHELAHVVQTIENTSIAGSMGHGEDFRNAWLWILDEFDADMARRLREKFTCAGLSY
jgi:hypothetical protein